MSPRPAAIAWTVIAAAWLAAFTLSILRTDLVDLILTGAAFTTVCLAIWENRAKTEQIQTLRTHIRIQDAKHRRESRTTHD